MKRFDNVCCLIENNEQLKKVNDAILEAGFRFNNKGLRQEEFNYLTYFNFYESFALSLQMNSEHISVDDFIKLL